MKSKPVFPASTIAILPFSVVQSSIHIKAFAPYFSICSLSFSDDILAACPAIQATIYFTAWGTPK
jgi:hypothetical protein